MAPPISKIKNGQFSVAIFENPKGKSVALQKSYTDKEGTWQNPSLTLFPKDIDTVIEILKETKEKLSGTPDSEEESSEASASNIPDNSIGFDDEVL